MKENKIKQTGMEGNREKLKGNRRKLFIFMLINGKKLN